MAFTIYVLQNIPGAPPIPNANVTATNQSTGTPYTGTTNQQGITAIFAPDGPYVLTVTATGYQPYTSGRINFGDGGGYILALTPVTEPPPPTPQSLLTSVLATIGIAAAIYYVITR